MNIDKGMLVDWEIVELMDNGELIITPFIEKNLGSVSYDVTLGEWFVRGKHTKDDNRRLIFNPASQKSIDNRWDKPKRAPLAKNTILSLKDLRESEIEPDEQIILLAPNEFILCHTQEFVGGVKSVTTSMHARSTVGRGGFTACLCAGFGDVGYFNRWTMEVHNTSSDYWLVLKIGQRVAQIHFEGVSTPQKLYSSSGHYQQTNDFNHLLETWDPAQMIPKPLT